MARFIETESTNPHHNLALEEFLTETAEDGQPVFFLWQNRRTVVIGRNQNALKECNAGQLEKDGGFLARRLSGGGSVYHDMGNLNFTFAATEADYDVNRQLSVILKALEAFDLHAEKTGRNDICINGRKFSGNAFLKRGGKCCHHGTILMDTDTKDIARYLNVSSEKLKAHSVSSVKSRVINLKELNEGIDIPGLKTALFNAFAEIYGTPAVIKEETLDAERIKALTEKFASREWLYGVNMKADYVTEGRFPWGLAEIRLKLNGEYIADAQIFTDALDDGLAESMAEKLRGVRFSPEKLAGLL